MMYVIYSHTKRRVDAMCVNTRACSEETSDKCVDACSCGSPRPRICLRERTRKGAYIQSSNGGPVFVFLFWSRACRRCVFV